MQLIQVINKINRNSLIILLLPKSILKFTFIKNKIQNGYIV